MLGREIELVHDENRWQRTRDALRLVCPHARVSRFVTAHVGRNALHFHRLFLVPSDSTCGSRVVDAQARKSWPLIPGTATLLPARRLYRFEFAAGLRLVGFHFRLEGPGGVDVLEGALMAAQHTDALAHANEARDALAMPTPGAWLVAEGLLRVHLGRTAAVSWAMVDRTTAAARHWNASMAQLEMAPPGGADIAQVARAAGVSRQHFTRRFTADFGCTPRAWHQRQLARRVVERLLTDDAPLATVAEEFAFSDAFAFSRFVVRTTGMRPTCWRQSQALVGD